MQQQPDSTPSSFAESPAPRPAPPPEYAPIYISTPESGEISTPEPGQPAPPQRIPRWLVRFELFLRVMIRLYIGIAVCYAPWSPTFWDRNPIFLQFPTLSIYAASGAVRGIVSGLGLLNLWFGLEDIVRHRER